MLGAAIAPGPRGNPITDHLAGLERDPLSFLLGMRSEHGDVVRLNLWPECAHLVSSPEGVRRVLEENRGNYHRLDSGPAAPARSAGLADVLPVEGIESHADVLAAGVARMLASWERRAARGERLDLAEEMVPLVLRVFCATVFAAEIDDDDVGAVGAALTGVLREAAPHLRLSGYQRLVHPPGPELQAAGRTLRDFAARVVPEAAASDADEPGETVIVLLLAGHATARALAWGLYVLAGDTGVRRRVEAELEAVVGARPLAVRDLPELSFLGMTVQETLRLYPPLWLLGPRLAAGDDMIAGYRIPAGSIVVVSPYVIHRHPGLWTRPDVFDPQRFETAVPRFAYMPFGAGPWGCVGSHWALPVMRFVLAAAAQRFRWELASEGPIVPEPRASLWPAGGLPAVLRPRAVQRERPKDQGEETR